jgi:hypothetical protein
VTRTEAEVWLATNRWIKRSRRRRLRESARQQRKRTRLAKQVMAR